MTARDALLQGCTDVMNVDKVFITSCCILKAKLLILNGVSAWETTAG
ncbi:hypothetical protein BDA96_03G065700 [Sorghum bicolor]|uniref:Uncharacterized protein n=1 Tax=Sorghum bicolor TaxID=4558 RepID=A0A921RAS9_SORBI|nr:hypothetical protein BDA96_03G065700 [Sorghum bicolor]